MTARLWEDYVSYVDRLAALDRLPRSTATDDEASRLNRLMRDIEEMYDSDELHSRYNDPEKDEVKERQIQAYEKMYRRTLMGVHA